MWRRFALTVALLVAVVLGVGAWWFFRRPALEPGTYRTSAIIKEIWAKDVVFLEHGSIPTLEGMDKPMSMAFYVASPGMLEGVKPGDRFEITLKETPGKLLIVKMERRSRA